MPADVLQCNDILVISAAVTLAPITGTPAVCAGLTTKLADATTGGIWSSSDTTIAKVGTTGLVTGIATGTATISYFKVNGACSSSVSASVTVNALPVVPAVTGINFVIVGNNTTLSNTVSGGLWTSSKTNIATVGATGVVTGVAAGVTVISYKVTNASGCTTTVTQNITVYKSLAVTLAATKILCNGSGSTLTATVTGGSGSYQYRLNNGTVQSANTFSVLAGTDTVTVTDLVDGQILSKTITVAQPTPLIWTLVSVVNASGGLSNGSIR